MNETNKGVVLLLRIVASVIFLSSFILGIALNIKTHYITIIGKTTEFNFAYALIYWGSGLIVGIPFIWMAEILKQLRVIRNAMHRDENKNSYLS